MCVRESINGVEREEEEERNMSTPYKINLLASTQIQKYKKQQIFSVHAC
jgi:hypothetical protein